MIKKKCKYCRELFTPDKRVCESQVACTSKKCLQLRKKDNNQAFKKKNPNYWKDRYEYLKEWRRKNPDYQRKWRNSKKSRAEIEIQTAKSEEENEIQPVTMCCIIDSIEQKLQLLREIQASMAPQSIDIKGQTLYPNHLP